MTVSYVQPIFTPNKELLDRNLDSVRSFFKYYTKNGYSFSCVFGGYSANDELWDEITGEIDKLAVEAKAIVHVKRFSKNYGKAYVVNALVKEFVSTDYFLTADSDIQYDENEADIIGRCLDAFDEARRIHLNPSLIALNQEQNNCHLLGHCYENKYPYVGKFGDEMLCRPNGGGGVAGGCLFILADFWRKVDGYKVLGVYAGDDANLMLDSYRNGYHFFMADSIKCIHPFEDNREYLNWKSRVCPQAGPLNASMIEANTFWNSQGIDQVPVISESKFSYVICHSNTSEYRETNLKSLIKYLRLNFKNEIEIVVSEQGPIRSQIADVDVHVFFEDSGLFQRSKVLNNGVMAATYKKVFVGDNDVLLNVEAINKTLSQLEEYEVVNPYHQIIDLSERDSINFKLFLNLHFENNWNTRASIVLSGGCFAILKEAYVRLGGFDEDIIGWGGEDDAFTYKIAALTRYIGVDSLAYHLYHNRGINGTPNHDHYNKNVEILNKVSGMNIEELKKYCEDCRVKLNGR
jgi:hypothetical protein